MRPIFWVGLSVLLVTGAVNLEVPLYSSYARAAGVGHGVAAGVFAAYVLGLVPVLVLLGGISDRIGRKPCLLLGLAAALAATLLVTLFPSLSVLLPARLLQGVAVGLTVGTGTAYIAELLGDEPARAARIVAPLSTLGFGGGALATTLALTRGHTLVPLTYPLLIVALVIGVLALVTLVPALPAKGGPLLRLPLFSREMRPAGMAIGTAWAVSGLVVAVVPAELAQHGFAFWSGPVIFLISVAGVAVQPIAQGFSPRRALLVGLFVIPCGYALLVLGAVHQTLAAVLAGACIAGAGCYGFVYLGGLARVAELGGAERARAVAGYLLCAYLGFGLPSIAVGYAADMLGLTPALGLFGCVLLCACTGLAIRLAREAESARTIVEGHGTR